MKNPAQAGDAVLALYYENFSYEANLRDHLRPCTRRRETTVHTSGTFNFDSRIHWGKSQTLEFWGASKGIVNIPLSNECSLFESIVKMDFKAGIELFTHFVIKHEYHFFSNGREGEVEYIDIHRLDQRDKTCFFEKNIYF